MKLARDFDAEAKLAATKGFHGTHGQAFMAGLCTAFKATEAGIDFSAVKELSAWHQTHISPPAGSAEGEESFAE
jgi:hypothetical protein